MRTRSLGAFGVEVFDVDLGKPFDEDGARELVSLVARNQVAVFRAQKLTKAVYDRFGRIFGSPVDFFFTVDLDDDYPAIIKISNDPSLDPGRHNGAAFWHSDGSYEYMPASFTMLYGVEAPQHGGETLFVDLCAAYEALPEATRAKYDALKVRHRLVGGKRAADETPLALDPDEPDRDGGVRAKKRAAEQPIHPLVITHPITGRKSLYAVAGTPFSVEGLSTADSDALLDDVKAHATQDRFMVAPKVGAGDVIIWDNLSTMHKATPLEYSNEDGKRRAMLRISTCGLPPAYESRTHIFARQAGVASIKLERASSADHKA